MQVERNKEIKENKRNNEFSVVFGYRATLGSGVNADTQTPITRMLALKQEFKQAQV
jgi:hypothetical protein